MRAIWRGAVSFGLVNVPVRVYAATAAQEVRFHQVHAADGGRVRYSRVCEVDGQAVPYGEIAKGYETDTGDLVVLTDDDLGHLPLATGREIEVVEFVPTEQVDPVMFDRAYYLEPEASAAKPYALLREALARTERVAVVKVALRQRESLAVLRVRGDVICLQTLLWPEEVRAPDIDLHGAGDAASLRPQEVTMAAQLVESLAADFDPAAFSDGYTAAVRELVAEKVARGDVRARPGAPAAEDGGGQVVDLLSALQRSVERARAARGEDGAAPGGEDAAPRGEASATTTKRRAPRSPRAASKASTVAAGEPGAATSARAARASRAKPDAAAQGPSEGSGPSTSRAEAGTTSRTRSRTAPPVDEAATAAEAPRKPRRRSA